MNRVGIVGYANTPFTKEEQKIESILHNSANHLFKNNSEIDKKLIDSVLVSTNNNSKYLSAILSEMVGIQPKIAHSIESLCNSGTNSIVSAFSYISSGLAEMVLVTGAERVDSPGQILEWDNSRGEFKHPIFWASMFSKSYKQEFNISEEDLAIVSVKNHKQAQKNPNALSKKTYTVEDVINSKKLTEDLRLLDCSRPCSGGASILLASEQLCKKISDNPIWISGIGQKTTSAGFTKNESLFSMKSTKEAGDTALKMANKNISEVDVAEIHDAFSVCEPMALDALGFTKPGKGMNLIKKLHDTDNFMINPRGGLIGCGHPLGATGISQTIEIVKQLQQSAEDRQVNNPKLGLVHNMSAASYIVNSFGIGKMNFEEELTKGNFTIPECSSCKKIVWPPAEFCDVCYNETRLKSGQFTGKIIEFSKQGNEYFCMVEFVDSFRLMAKIQEKPVNGQIVKISKCGILNDSYFFQVI